MCGVTAVMLQFLCLAAAITQACSRFPMYLVIETNVCMLYTGTEWFVKFTIVL